MKISNFLEGKRIVFDGEVPKVIKANLDDVVLHNLSNDLVKKLNDEVVQKLVGDENDEMIAYKMFPYLSNIEMDVDFETFRSMMISPPNNNFAVVIEQIIDSMNDFFDKGETINKANKKAEELEMKTPKIPKSKSKEEIKNELEKELLKLKLDNTPEGKLKRREIFLKLAELED